MVSQPKQRYNLSFADQGKCKDILHASLDVRGVGLCNQHLYKLSNEDLYRNHDFFGGIPRYVFDKDQTTVRALVDEALELCDIMDSPQALAKKNAFLDEFSDKLIIVEPVGLENYRLEFDQCVHAHGSIWLPTSYEYMYIYIYIHMYM